MFVLQNAPQAALELPGLALRTAGRRLRHGEVRSDAVPDETRRTASRARSSYSTDLFDARDDRAPGRPLPTLLEALAARPGRAARRAAAADRGRAAAAAGRLERHGAPTSRASPPARALRGAGARTPDAVAVVFGTRAADLRASSIARANQLARHLRGWAWAPDSLVGLCLERSLELVVGMLAHPQGGRRLRAAGPGLPADRLAFMLADSGLPVLVTHERRWCRTCPPQARVVRLDTERPQIGARAGDAGHGATPEHWPT